MILQGELCVMLINNDCEGLKGELLEQNKSNKVDSAGCLVKMLTLKIK